MELRKSFSIRVLSLFFSIFHPTHLWDLKYLENRSFVLGGGGGTRTQDLWVVSRTHYPLHYGDAADNEPCPFKIPMHGNYFYSWKF